MKKVIFKIVLIILSIAYVAYISYCVYLRLQISGTYENVGAFTSTVYNIDKLTFYKKTTPDAKGTFRPFIDSGFVLYEHSSDYKEIFKAKDKYYYRTNNIRSFKQDKNDDKLKLDKNGRTDQTFEAFYFIYGNCDAEILKMTFHKDGTCVVSYFIRSLDGSVSDEKTFDGTYSVDDYIMYVNYDECEHIFLIIDNYVYFDVITKA